VEVHPLVITCGSLPSTTDSGTRADQMRCARQRVPPHQFVWRTAAATWSVTLPGPALPFGCRVKPDFVEPAACGLA
jgi:hypothetical protein